MAGKEKKGINHLLDDTSRMLSETELLLTEIEEMIRLCESEGDSGQRRNRTIHLAHEGSIVEDGESLIIENFRFDCTANREDLRKAIKKK